MYAAFLTRKAWDRYRLDEAAFDQLKAKEKDKRTRRTRTRTRASRSRRQDAAAPKPPSSPRRSTSIDHRGPHRARCRSTRPTWRARCFRRTARRSITWPGSTRVTTSGSTFRARRRSSCSRSWTRRRPTSSWTATDKKAFVLADGRLTTVELESGKETSVSVSAKMELNDDAERAYMFEHIWRQTLEKFLDIGMHGVDWKAHQGAVRALPSLHRQQSRLRRDDVRDAGRAERVAHRLPLPADAPRRRRDGGARFLPGRRMDGRGREHRRGHRGRAAPAGGHAGQGGRRDRGHRRLGDFRGRQLVSAAEPQGRCARATGAARAEGWRALGGDGARRSRGARSRGCSTCAGSHCRRDAVDRLSGGPARLRAHPRHERRRVPRGLRGNLRARRSTRRRSCSTRGSTVAATWSRR